MKFFLTLLLLLGSWLGALAENERNDDFNYTTKSTGEIYITSYRGNAQTLIIPREIVAKDGNSYPVTKINSLMAGSVKITEKVFIPSSVQTICETTSLFNTEYNKSLKTVIFENGSFSIHNKTAPITVSSYSSETNVFDNVIVLDNCDYTIKELVSLTSDNLYSHFLRVGYITISYIDNTEEQNVRMYLHRRDDSKALTFNQERLEYLLFALETSGKNLSTIAEINLSDMASEADIVFEQLTLPESCINAKITTHVIKDLSDYTAPTSDLPGVFAYSRTNTQDWNSVCLPFPIRESDFPEGTKIYTMTGGNEEKILLNRIGQDDLLAAGTPCFIKSDAETWDLNINATIPANITPNSVTQEGNSWLLKGCFSEIELGTGKYKLNSEGSQFVRTAENSHAWPFRCYLEPKNNGQGAPARLSVGVDEEASITLVPNDAEPQTVKLIDLMGRPRQGNAPGLYIRAKH